MNKTPRFFCDNCGREVVDSIKACPFCGTIFASVRCPRCGYVSDEKSFANGCPACNYATTPDNTPAAKPRKQKVSIPPLPLWVYVFSVAAFVAIFAVLYVKLAR